MFEFLGWLLPPVAGVADGLTRGIIKLTKVHKFILIGFGFLFALPYYLGWLMIEGIPVVQPLFWKTVAFHVPLMILALILQVEAHRCSPLILTAPYLSLTPAFLLIISPILGGGRMTVWGVIGVLIITVGLYLLNTKTETDSQNVSLLAPLRQLKKEKGSRYMLWVSFLFAVTSNLDYLAFKNSSLPFYLAIDHGLIGIICVILALIYRTSGRIKPKEITPKGSWRILMLMGVALACSTIPFLLALIWNPVVPYAISGKRIGMILTTVGIGLVISVIKRFRGRHSEEHAQLKCRIPGILLMIIGMVIIIYWGKIQ
ncbi:hypothetical protein KKF32_00960 [Patescibacteria group bacterium]|nr:hypothetical protein [Patescibacteria group bacterium]